VRRVDDFIDVDLLLRIVEVRVILRKDTRALVHLATDSFSGLLLMDELRNLGTECLNVAECRLKYAA
jgi:hypothetical protein